MEFRSQYWDDEDSKSAFKRFLKAIHGLDLTKWDESGYWDHSYTPFSYFLDGEVVSSVCLYLIDARFLGQDCKVAQISGVGTAESHRRQGLNRQLTQRALEWASSKFTCLFLFADEDAKGFYRRLDFEARQDFYWTSTTPFDGRTRDGVHLDLTSKAELEWIFDLSQRRCPPSNEFACLQSKLLMFHLLYDPSCEAIRIPDRELAIVVRRMEDRLQILDVIGTTVPAFQEWYPFLALPPRARVDFLLPIDILAPPEFSLEPAVGNNAFVRSDFPLREPVFPATIFA